MGQSVVSHRRVTAATLIIEECIRTHRCVVASSSVAKQGTGASGGIIVCRIEVQCVVPGRRVIAVGGGRKEREGPEGSIVLTRC